METKVDYEQFGAISKEFDGVVLPLDKEDPSRPWTVKFLDDDGWHVFAFPNRGDLERVTDAYVFRTQKPLLEAILNDGGPEF